MIDSRYRNFYQRYCIEPLLQLKVIRKLSPLFLTLCGLACGIVSAVLIGLDYPLWAFGFLLFSGFLDTLDGSLARVAKSSSSIGAVLDITCDRIVEFAIIFGLFCLDPSRAFLCMLMLGSVLICITSFLVVGIFVPNQSEKSFHYSSGLMERTEAFLFFSLMILIPTAFKYLSLGFTGLVFLTAFKRLFDFCYFERRHDVLEKEER